MRGTQGDVTADDFEMEALTIPNAEAVTVQSLRSDQDYDDKIMGWEIIDNDDTIEVGKTSSLAIKTSPVAGVGFSPPVAKRALSTTFVKAAGGVDVSAVLVIFTSSEPVRVPRPPVVPDQ